MITIDIRHESDQWPACEDLVEKTIHAANTSDLEAELSIVLADNHFIQNLNKTYRGQDKPTNVLSFPQDEDQLLGDIVLAYETIADEARMQNKIFEDHLTHLLVHGFLHLLGHDHEDDKEAANMEALEIDILQKIGIKNPYKNLDSV